MKKIRPAIKCHGGKFYLSPWIISHFPSDYQNYTYVEPFAGGASVLINKNPSVVEVLGDIDLTIIQIFRALRDEPKEFVRRLNLLKYSEEAFQKAVKRSAEPFDDYLDHAVNEFTLRRMSRGGLRKAFAWSQRLRGGQPGDVNAWKTALQLLPQIAERIKEVYLFNNPATDIIKAFNASNTLVYVDPPYLHETRKAKQAYTYEMTADQHIELAKTLNTFQGKVVLSGYPSPLYTRLYKGWNSTTKKIANHSSQKKAKDVKTEILYWNF